MPLLLVLDCSVTEEHVRQNRVEKYGSLWGQKAVINNKELNMADKKKSSRGQRVKA